MYIDQEACVGCGLCVPYCPVGAISVSGRKAVIDADACVECSCCRRSRVCRKDAICQEELKMPRAVRSVMSDVFTIFEDTGVSGRGTEEMKTNEVTGRFKPGWVGMALEAGRPIAAATFRQVQEIAVALAGTGLVEFETCNPITQMMKDNRTGYFGRISWMSGSTPPSWSSRSLGAAGRGPGALQGDRRKDFDRIQPGCLQRHAGRQDQAVREIMEGAGFSVRPNGKVNLGLAGRCTSFEKGREETCRIRCIAGAPWRA